MMGARQKTLTADVILVTKNRKEAGAAGTTVKICLSVKTRIKLQSRKERITKKAIGYYYSVQESSLAPVKERILVFSKTRPCTRKSAYSCHKENCSGFKSALR